MKDGAYLIQLDGIQYKATISTLMDGQYPDCNLRQFVVIGGYFPIPVDSWMLENALFTPTPMPCGK